MVRRWDPCSSFGIAYFSGPSGLLRQLETWPRRRLWWPIKRPHWSPEMLWVLARRFAWYQTTHLVQDVPACLRHWLGWLWFWMLCIFNLNNLALATSLLLMRNYVTGVGVESAWHAWDWVSTGVVVVPGPSAAVSCQSPEVKVLIITLIKVMIYWETIHQLKIITLCTSDVRSRSNLSSSSARLS